MATELPGSVPRPVPSPRDERIVDRDFWAKLLRVAGRIPFAEDAAAAYFCAIDPATPAKVRAVLFAALAYFVMPFDLVPDFLAGIGFTDDAAVIAMALSVVAGAIKDGHRARARAALRIAEPPAA
ncbi:MAG TPA: YkvA family protein [Rhizomicrobium sp.]